MFDLGNISLPGFKMPPPMFPDIIGGVGDFVGKLPSDISHLADSIHKGAKTGIHEASDLINYSENKILSPIKNNLIDSIGNNAQKFTLPIAGLSIPIMIGGVALIIVLLRVL